MTLKSFVRKINLKKKKRVKVFKKNIVTLNNFNDASIRWCKTFPHLIGAYMMMYNNFATAV